MLLIVCSECLFDVFRKAAGLRWGRLSRTGTRGGGSRTQPSRWMDSLSERVFFDSLNEVEKDFICSIRVRRKGDLTEPREVSLYGRVRNEPRMFQPIPVENRAVQGSDNFENSTWGGPRVPRRPTTTTRRHKMASVHNRKVVVREQDAMVTPPWLTMLLSKTLQSSRPLVLRILGILRMHMYVHTLLKYAPHAVRHSYAALAAHFALHRVLHPCRPLRFFFFF